MSFLREQFQSGLAGLTLPEELGIGIDRFIGHVIGYAMRWSDRGAFTHRDRVHVVCDAIFDGTITPEHIEEDHRMWHADKQHTLWQAQGSCPLQNDAIKGDAEKTGTQPAAAA